MKNTQYTGLSKKMTNLSNKKKVGYSSNAKKMMFGAYSSNAKTNENIGGGISAGATLVSGALDSISPEDEFGVQKKGVAIASGALKGAAAGAAFGPYGAAAGALIGGTTSFIQQKAASRQKEGILKDILKSREKSRLDAVNQKIANNPELLGNINAQMKYGGKLRFAPVLTNVMPTVGVHPTKFRKMEMGGDSRLDMTSSGTATIKGNSHKKGGVQFPEINAELEGNETMANDGFVFSKELGFAKKHQVVGNSMGKTEARLSTQYSVLDKNTLMQLKRKEGYLKLSQEQTKQSMGIPNELDQPKPKKMEMGGGTAHRLLSDKFMAKMNTINTPNVSTQSLSKELQPITQNPYKLTGKLPELPVAPELKEKRKGSISNAAPFVSNVVNAFRKLPMVPAPIEDPTISLPLVSFDADRAEANRQRIGANKVAERNLSSNSFNAVKSANLSAQMRANNQINQAEQNANVAIKGQQVITNASITQGNIAKQNQFNQLKIERLLRKQTLDSENIANLGDKVQQNRLSNKVIALEDDKMLLAISQDTTAASMRLGDDVLKRNLSPNNYQEMLKLKTKLESANEQEAEAIRLQIRQIIGKSSTTLPIQKQKEKSAK